LTVVEHGMLEFEGHWWTLPGSKEELIVTGFRMNPTTYYQRLNKLIKHPLALAEYPTVVNRLRRIQEGSMRRRLAW